MFRNILNCLTHKANPSLPALALWAPKILENLGFSDQSFERDVDHLRHDKLWHLYRPYGVEEEKTHEHSEFDIPTHFLNQLSIHECGDDHRMIDRHSGVPLYIEMCFPSSRVYISPSRGAPAACNEWSLW